MIQIDSLASGHPTRRQARGAASRSAILNAAAELATVRGLDGLSIGDLADHLGMSKSGLYAHFKSKQQLQLATVDIAAQIFDSEVLTPATASPAGLARLRALVDKFLSHVKRRVFPGGCFFAAVSTEMRARPGPVRDKIMQAVAGWLRLLEDCLRDARAQSEIDPSADVSQLAFEIEAMLLAGNTLFILSDDPKFLSQARRGVESILKRASRRSGSAARRFSKS